MLKKKKTDDRILISKILTLEPVQHQLRERLLKSHFSKTEIADIVMESIGKLSKYVECPNQNVKLIFSVYKHKSVNDIYIFECLADKLGNSDGKPQVVLAMTLSNNFKTINYNHVLYEDRIELKR